MKYLIIICLVVQSLLGHGQSNKSEIAILKKQVGLLSKVITADSNLLLLDNEAILVALKAVWAENDSLELVNQILQAELLLLENKKLNYTYKEFDSGIYIVVISSRSESDIQVLYNWISNKNLGTPMDIYYNTTTQWYHVVVNKSYTLENIGITIATYREEGFTDCWFMKI
jgi:hypothetical protein